MDGFLAPGGGGGFLPIGGGGPFTDAEETGRDGGMRFFRNWAIDGCVVVLAEDVTGGGLAGAPGTGGAATVGNLGGSALGARGTEGRDDSGSDVYDESLLAIH